MKLDSFAVENSFEIINRIKHYKLKGGMVLVAFITAES